MAGCIEGSPTADWELPTQAASPMSSDATATSAVTASCTPLSTSIPSATPTPTPIPPPTWTPSPTPQPGAQYETAHRLQINGEYELAIAAYLSLLEDGAPDHEERQTRFRLGECYLLVGNYAEAVAALEDFAVRYPEDERVPAVTLMAARAYHAEHNCTDAITSYQNYLEQETIIADMVYEWIGDCNASQAALEEAIAAYRQALDTARDKDLEVRLREKLAAAHGVLADYDAALSEYDAMLSASTLDSHRARIDYMAGQVLLAAGEPQLAYARFRRVVADYPSQGYAHPSLEALVEAGQEVDEFQRGLVDFHAGASYLGAYVAAIEAFDRYLQGDPETKADQALYRKAQSQRALGDTDKALDTLELLIVEYPKSEWLASAWLEKARTLAATGDSDRAVKAYLDLAAFFPANELAPKALWQAAELREEEGNFSEAARLYADVQFGFPALEDADRALWHAGLLQYRTGAQDQAMATWSTLLEKYPESPYKARCLYWLGKLGATFDTEEGDHWDQLLAAEPRGFYALRVQQIRSGESLTSTRLITTAIAPPPFAAPEAETEILAWLHSWTEVPTNTSLVELPVPLMDHPRLRRGQALLDAGLRLEALDEFGKLRSTLADEPVALAQLALYFQGLGLPAQAARSAYRLVWLWPDGPIQDAPLALQRLIYPLAYADLLSAEAQNRNLDPLLLAALVRQESYFEPLAESSAGARGLGQIMPSTALGIATSLHLDDFDVEDLYRPTVSIRFAAYYLSAQLRYFDNQLLVALAAYNGGPGNTLRWLEIAGPDLDLFVEVITAEQSQRYLREVYAQYLFYEALYRSPGAGQ